MSTRIIRLPRLAEAEDFRNYQVGFRVACTLKR